MHPTLETMYTELLSYTQLVQSVGIYYTIGWFCSLWYLPLSLWLVLFLFSHSVLPMIGHLPPPLPQLAGEVAFLIGYYISVPAGGSGGLVATVCWNVWAARKGWDILSHLGAFLDQFEVRPLWFKTPRDNLHMME